MACVAAGCSGRGAATGGLQRSPAMPPAAQALAQGRAHLPGMHAHCMAAHGAAWQVRNVANTGVLPWAGRLLATFEAGQVGVARSHLTVLALCRAGVR